MKKLFIFLIFLMFSFVGFSQEYDDMYFNRNDRFNAKKHSKHQKDRNLKSINPEYIERYVAKPKVKTVVYTTNTYNRIRPRHYNNWHWNVSFGYHYGWNSWYPYYGYNYYSWYPYHYDPFFMHHNYYSWNYPRHYYGYYGGYHHNYYNNYAYMHHYNTKKYVTTHKNEVIYQKRRTNRSSAIRIPPKSNQKVSNRRVTNNNNIRIPDKSRDSYSRSKDTRGSVYMNRPTRQTKSNTSTYMRNKGSYKSSNTYQNRSSRSTYTAPSRSTSPSRSSGSYSPSRSSGSSSPSRSTGSSSRGRRD